MTRWSWLSFTCLVGWLGACSPPVPDSPTKDERHALAEAACPSVLRPFLFSIEKDGARSYMLGTRHTGVALAKFPAFVQERFATAKTVVLESVHPDTTAAPRARASRWRSPRRPDGR